MNTLESDKLVIQCHFRADGVFCCGGLLYYSKEHAPAPREQLVAEQGCNETRNGPCASAVYFKPILLESEPVTCSICEGKGVILTGRGKELLVFFDTFLRPKVYEMCSDYIDNKLGLS